MHTTVESAVAMARKNRVTGGSFNIDEFLIRYAVFNMPFEADISE